MFQIELELFYNMTQTSLFYFIPPHPLHKCYGQTKPDNVDCALDCEISSQAVPFRSHCIVFDTFRTYLFPFQCV